MWSAPPLHSHSSVKQMSERSTSPPNASSVLNQHSTRYPAQVSRHRQRRLAQQSKVIQDISWKAHVRRCQRDRTLIARGKHANPVVVAMARALVGFLWAIANQVPVTPSGEPTPCRVQQALWRSPTGIGRDAAPVRCHPRPREGTCGILVPRARQAPDGGQSGGSKPMAISRINRRFLRARRPLYSGG
jgi:hypothetical protein